MIVFIVAHPDTNNVAIVSGNTPDDAKRRAHAHLGYPQDGYVVMPLTEEGQGVFLDLQLTQRSYS